VCGKLANKCKIDTSVGKAEFVVSIPKAVAKSSRKTV
jgi:hypothetical protein